MCVKCGCGYLNGDWKYDMQPMVFADGSMKIGPVVVQPPNPSEYYEDSGQYEDSDKYEDD